MRSFVCAPKSNLLRLVVQERFRVFFFTIMNNPSENVSDRCRVCSFVFIYIKIERNLNGEFLKIFEEVFNQKVLPDDGLRVQFATLVAIELKHHGNVIVSLSLQPPSLPKHL